MDWPSKEMVGNDGEKFKIPVIYDFSCSAVQLEIVRITLVVKIEIFFDAPRHFAPPRFCVNKPENL